MSAATSLSAAPPPSWVSPEHRDVYHLVADAKDDEGACAVLKAIETSRSEPWTRERLAQLVRLWAAGATCAAMAEALGGGISRNAVIGKVNRLGLPSFRPRGSNGIAVAKTRMRSAPAPALAIVAPASPTPSRIAADPPERVVGPPPADGIGIFDLKPHHCRWPLSGEKLGIRYCGAARRPDATVWYCEAHVAVAGQSRQSKEEAGISAQSKRRGSA